MPTWNTGLSGTWVAVWALESRGVEPGVSCELGSSASHAGGGDSECRHCCQTLKCGLKELKPHQRLRVAGLQAWRRFCAIKFRLESNPIPYPRQEGTR